MGRSFTLFLTVMLLGLALFGNFAGPADLLSVQSYPPKLVSTVAAVAALAALLHYLRQRVGAPLSYASSPQDLFEAAAEMAEPPQPRGLELLGLLSRVLAGLFALAKMILGGLGKGFGSVLGAGRGAAGKAGRRWGLAGVLTILGGLALALGLAARSEVPLFAAMLLLGLAAAVRYDPSLVGALSLVAVPRLYNFTVLALCLGIVFFLIGGFDSLAQSVHRLSYISNLDLAGNLVLAAASFLIALPLLVALAQGQPAEARRPLWPLTASLLGGGLVLLFGWFSWAGLATAITEQGLGSVKLAEAATFVAAIGLTQALGAACWWQAATRDPELGFDWPGAHRKAMMIWAALAGLATLANLAVFLVDPELGPGWRFSQVAGSLCEAICCVLWSVALYRISRMEPEQPKRMVASWLMLVILFPLTAMLSGIVYGGGDWGQVLILFTLPVAVFAWAVVAIGVPRWTRAIMGLPRA